MFLQPYVSTPQCSCSLMLPHLIVPAASCFRTSVFLQSCFLTSVFLQSYVSSPQCSCSLVSTPVFLQPYVSTPQCSCSLIFPHQCSCSLMFPHLNAPAAICFLISVFLQPYVSTPQCSCSPVFPQCSLSPTFSELRCSFQWIHMDLTLTVGQTLSDLAQPQTQRGTHAQTPTKLDKRFGNKLKYCRCASSLLLLLVIV